MAFHTIGFFGFIDWRGPPPPLVQQRIATFTRPGVDGVGQQSLGIWGDSVDVELTAHFSSFLLAEDNANLMRFLPGAGLNFVNFAGVDYFARYGHRYLVDKVEHLETQSFVRSIGPNWDYPNGAELLVRFTITPVV